MTTLIIGASGATGMLLVEQLLQRGHDVKIIVRTANSFLESIKNNKNVTIIQASILDLSDAEMTQHVKGCISIASCLGHNMSFKGIYGKPHRLVTDSTRRLCRAIKENDPKVPVKFVLMNTTGNSNRDLSEKISFGQKCIILLLRFLLPPHIDNEQAADFLRTEIGQNNKVIEWVAVRPDGLVDEREVTEYEIHPSPTRSAIFDAGRVSRINVSSFMAELITDQDLWMKWKGQMPVIYSKASIYP
ncbi:SDR family oxidoreductase [Shewanella sp. SG41-4]|uniref:NAD(P)-dependent oxidoreductase n=1 Tax=Shewanella sp. SG41-4 TaxID=2760976 RepID=UPI001601CF27|nr:NAD(P)-binding oxidoreductase [Shewanella sp. SG41-4]MBB1439227.1 SDR family oxidoreductase [Shewanella sp. SG41-4]